MPYHLIYLLGDRKGQKITLEEGKVLTMGRSTTADVAIDDHKVSRIHCQIEVVGDKCSVADLNSTNGTFVNGKRITEQTLRHNDHLAIGTTSFIVKQEPPPSQPEKKKGEVRFCFLCKGSVTQRDIDAGEATWLGERLFCPQCIKESRLKRALEELSRKRKEQQAHGSHQSAVKVATGTTIGGYTIKKKIGEGILGPTYMAEQVSMHRIVALKILSERATADPAWLNDFLKQAHVAAQLVHPNILLVYDIGNAEGLYYVSMEYVDGNDAETMLKQQKGFPVRKALSIVLQVAQADEHAFEHDIPHRDIRPRNILIDKTGTAKLAGFGTSFLLSKKPPKTIPRSELPLEVFAYQPPEFFEEDAELDFRSDIYSLGATLYHLLSGKSAFTANNLPELRRKIQLGDFKHLPELVSGFPKPVCDIVDRAMQRNPDKRYNTPRELVAALNSALKEL